MKKRFALNAMIGTLLLLTGCGGGGSSSSISDHEMASKDVVIIFYHYPEDVCLDNQLIELLKSEIPEATNIITRVEDNSVICRDYGKEYGTDCMTKHMVLENSAFATIATSCVLGADSKYGLSDPLEDSATLLSEKAFDQL